MGLKTSTHKKQSKWHGVNIPYFSKAAPAHSDVLLNLPVAYSSLIKNESMVKNFQNST